MSGVRPTKRCLDDLELSFPPLDIPLESLGHALIEKAQRLPEEFNSGGAERIRSLTDNVWFKVKTGYFRGAAGELNSVEKDIPRRWWLAAAADAGQLVETTSGHTP